MSYQERLPIISMIFTTVLTVIYFIIVYQRYFSGIVEINNEFKYWAWVIIIYVPIQVVSRIIIMIIHAIINKIITNEDIPSSTDEMEKLIDIKSSRNSSTVYGIGVLLSMVTQIANMPPYIMFSVILFSMFIGSISADISTLYYNRKGV